MRIETDVAIVGGGPGGASSALFLAERGIKSTIIESDSFPRFHIGESMTGECGGLVRKLGFADQMATAGHAVKHGVTVYGSGGRNKFWVPVMRRTEEGLEATTTWQVRRSLFDGMLLDAARNKGTDFLPGLTEHPVINDDGSVGGVSVTDLSGNTHEVRSKVLIDATGRKTWLANAGVTGPKIRDKYDNQIAIFCHFAGAKRDPGEAGGNTLIFYKDFLQWGWFIPLDDETVSVGIVTPTTYFKSKGEIVADFFRRELRELNPELAGRVEEAQEVEAVRAATNYSYFVDDFTGPGFVCVGDSHRFIDPIFSFGLYMTISDAEMAANSIADHLQGTAPTSQNPFLGYQERSKRGLGAFQDLIDGFWANPLGFGYMVHHTDHWEQIIDMFAGRVFDEQPLEAQLALQKLAAASNRWTTAAAKGLDAGDETVDQLLSQVMRG